MVLLPVVVVDGDEESKVDICEHSCFLCFYCWSSHDPMGAKDMVLATLLLLFGRRVDCIAGHRIHGEALQSCCWFHKEGYLWLISSEGHVCCFEL
jgi:hypothetical protein